jgi:hypothetical protein
MREEIVHEYSNPGPFVKKSYKYPANLPTLIMKNDLPFKGVFQQLKIIPKQEIYVIHTPPF